MGKVKNSKKAMADRVYAKKSIESTNPFAKAVPATSKKLNPFEVHINREKFQILGRICKHDKGLPGVSRAKAVKKRKETLGLEYRDKHKSNQFRDRRIGKFSSAGELSEDVLNARFVAEKMSQIKQSKASRFNLNDDEVLTHRGQTLEEIEQFRDERSDDEEFGDEKLDADFTEMANFGGDAAQSKDRKSAIEEMILEQKKRKMEIAKEKDEVNELTEKLDTNYKSLIGLLGQASKNEVTTKKQVDDYDKVLREMVFEPRGAVSDKLLSEEEIARKEKERLEILENARLKRMEDENNDVVKEQPKHRSADDLDDGYFANEDEQDDGVLAYTMDGELGTHINHSQVQAGDNDSEIEKSENEDEEEDDANALETDNESDSEGDENSEETENEDTENESGEENDNLSDLKASDSEDENENSEITKMQTKFKKEKSEKTKNCEESTATDLPFTIDMPASYKEFLNLLDNRTPVQNATIVERLIKCNHPKLDGVNREKVVKLFAFLLQYINELFTDATQVDITRQFEILDKLNPHLYDLVHLSPEKMSATLINVIREKYAAFRRNSKIFPGLDTVIFFKLVSNYYSTSDFRHTLATPCYMFMQHILSKARVRTRQDVALGLFIVTIALEFAQQSKRFLPAALNYLLGMLYLCVPKRPIEVFKILPPFQNSGPMSILLTIPKNLEDNTITEQLMQSEDLVTTTFSVDFKIRALNTTLKLIEDVISNSSEIIGANYLAEGLLEMLGRLPIDVYPDFVRKSYDATLEILKNVTTKSLKKIVPPEKRPKALRLLEPRIETVYDDKRRPKLSKEKEERAKLVHKLKRETKGALREIRRDTDFVQKMRIQQQIQSDIERKEKVKRIYQEASVQQGELNELTRSKKKKKF